MLIVVLCSFNPLNAELSPICHLLALLGAHHIFHVSRVRVKVMRTCLWKSSVLIMMCSWDFCVFHHI